MPDLHADTAPRPPRNWRMIVPSVVTLTNGTCGFAAIVLISRLQFDPLTRAYQNPELLVMAGWLLLVGFVCDMFDGMAARMLKASGPFGAELDSLCDVISFGVAPAVAVAAVTRTAHIPWLVTAGGICGGALLIGAIVRLARFNVENLNEEGGHLYFKGLPSPSAANAVVSLVLLESSLRHDSGWHRYISGDLAIWWADRLVEGLPFIALVIGLLMVSTFRYADLPKHYLKRLQPTWHLAVLAVVAALMGTAVALATLFVGYVAYRPIAATVVRLSGKVDS